MLILPVKEECFSWKQLSGAVVSTILLRQSKNLLFSKAGDSGDRRHVIDEETGKKTWRIPQRPRDWDVYHSASQLETLEFSSH